MGAAAWLLAALFVLVFAGAAFLSGKLVGGLVLFGVSLFFASRGVQRALGAWLGRERLLNEVPRELLEAVDAPAAAPPAPAPSVDDTARAELARDRCPMCKEPLADAAGAFDERRCPSGHGGLVSSSATERVLERAGVDVAIARELVKERGVVHGPCPACGVKMRQAQLKGVVVELCLGCGALWLDHGELDKLAREHFFSE